VAVQGRLLELVAEGAALDGTPAGLARRLGVAPGALQPCLAELARVGWVAVEVDGEGRLSIRLVP
jgi:DNA-binding IclR family transcriptional regulator